MNGEDNFFVDSNVFLYEMDGRNQAKQRAAADWILTFWGTGRGRLSWQVLHETYANAIRKLGVAPQAARETVRDLIEWKPIATNLEMIERSWHWCDRAQITYWDGLIVAAAEQSGSRWLLSEDFQSGRKFGEVTVVNPFERAPAEFGLSA
jgi:predicted nucleic acid-binding protein